MSRLLRSLLVGTAALLSVGLLVACQAAPPAGPADGGATAPPSAAAEGASPSPKAVPQPRDRPTAKTTGSGTVPTDPPSSRRPDDRSVPQSELVRLEIPEVLSGDAGGAISPDPSTNELTPPETDLVYRWAERGRPGTDATDTVYLLGHTVRAGGGVFDPLQEVEIGQSIIVDTEQGEVSYRVEATRMYPKNQIQQADEVYASVPGRLILVGCYLNPDGSRQDLNFVVFAQLD